MAGQTPIPYTLAGLIAACVNGKQVVSVQRKPPIDRLIRLDFNLAQGRLFSRIEAPYHLVLSPEIGTTWWGQVQPKANAADTRVELWHAAMIKSHPTPASKRPPHGGKLRAVWATDFTEQNWPASPPNHAHDPFRMSLDSRDRYELVRLTTDSGNYAEPVEADQLILSTMGGVAQGRGRVG